MTIDEAAKLALGCQDACNLSGVLFSFADAMHAICDEATAQKHGTEWKNTHPVVTVFLEKLMDLNRYRVGDSVARDEDFRHVEIMAGVA